MYELSLTEHVMMSSDQRSSLWRPTNLLALHESQLCHQHFAIFQEDQLYFRRVPVFPGGISNSSRFSVFRGAVDTLHILSTIPVYNQTRDVSVMFCILSWCEHCTSDMQRTCLYVFVSSHYCKCSFRYHESCYSQPTLKFIPQSAV